MKFYKINPNNPKEVFEHLGCEKAGAAILDTKSRTNLLLIKDLKTPAANILKQDALSIGADLAVPRGTIVCETPTVDCVLIGTDKHFEILAKKGSLQPFGLKNLAKELKNFTRPHRGKCEIMGVINANNCITTETANTSIKMRRYLMTAGMNQVKSNLANEPKIEAREATSINTPE